MKLIPFIILLTAVFTSASSVVVTYLDVFDIPIIPSTTPACGLRLLRAGYPTFGSIPSFPNIGGSFAVREFFSPLCGSCWNLSYTRSDETISSIYVTAMDHANDGFILSHGGFVNLGGQQAVAGGKINAEALRVNGSYCGLNF
jgi:hypothetical protein